MLDGLFPEDVVTAWGDPLSPSKPLFPAEEALVARAVAKRQREFAKGRECARTAMASFGLGDVILLSGESREPIWPADIVGSITHTAGLCAVAVGRKERYSGIGIDAEPAEPLAPEVAKRVVRDDEVGSLAANALLGDALIPLLLFSAKEAVYKCVFPITRRFLGFGDVSVSLEGATFRARLCVTCPPLGADSHVSGSFRLAGAHLVTAAWISRN